MKHPTPQPLHLDGVGKSYSAGKRALHDVTVRVDPGTVLAVLGPSGSGKSTVLNIVAGLQQPSAGAVRIGDTVLSTPTTQVRPERRDISMVFQDYALWPHMTVVDIIGYGLRYGANKVSAAQRRSRVAQLLELLQLTALGHRRPAELSGGQQQRVSIARALATEPALLLFDEPLSNLDTQLRQEMRDELGALFSQLQTTVMYVTHDFSEALALADKILILEQGHTVQVGDPQQVFTQPANPWAANLAGFTVKFMPQRVRSIATHVEMQFGDTWIPATAAGTGWEVTREHGFEATINPDGVQIGDAGDVHGTIRSSIYEGRHWRNRIETSGVGIVVGFSERKLDPGASVRYSIRPEAVLVFHPARAESTIVQESWEGASPNYV